MGPALEGFTCLASIINNGTGGGADAYAYEVHYWLTRVPLHIRFILRIVPRGREMETATCDTYGVDIAASFTVAAD